MYIALELILSMSILSNYYGDTVSLLMILFIVDRELIIQLIKLRMRNELKINFYRDENIN